MEFRVSGFAFLNMPLVYFSRIEGAAAFCDRGDLPERECWIIAIFRIGELHFRRAPATEFVNELIPCRQERFREVSTFELVDQRINIRERFRRKQDG